MELHQNCVRAKIGRRYGVKVQRRLTDKMLLPELMIDEALTKVAPAVFLRLLFDLMWNGFGQYGSSNYDRDGNYRLR